MGAAGRGGRDPLTAAWRPSLVPKALLRRDPTRDADVLLLPERVVKLNASAAAVLRLCDGRMTADEIASELSARHPERRVREDVLGFLERVRSEGWLR